MRQGVCKQDPLTSSWPRPAASISTVLRQSSPDGAWPRAVESTLLQAALFHLGNPIALDENDFRWIQFPKKTNFIGSGAAPLWGLDDSKSRRRCKHKRISRPSNLSVMIRESGAAGE
jgi:hypothetical protein